MSGSLIVARVTPAGPVRKLTVWSAPSLFVQVTVLFLPMMSVIVAGWKFRLCSTETPLGIVTWTATPPPPPDGVPPDDAWTPKRGWYPGTASSMATIEGTIAAAMMIIAHRRLSGLASYSNHFT